MIERFTKESVGLSFLILIQAACAVFFVYDVTTDAMELGANGKSVDLKFIFETVSAIGLIAAVIFETTYLSRLIRRKEHLERQASLAAGAFYEVIEDHFNRWGLTAAEVDVARFTIKGFSIADIAQFRSSAEGTIKSHLNAIYRKAGVGSRGELLSLLIEEMLGSRSTA